MITRILIPQIFENMEEATIGVWLKAEGDTVELGDALCELITEKTTFQLEAEGSGTLLRIVAAEKSIVPVGAIIAVLGEAGEEVPDIDTENAAREAKTSVAESKPEAAPALRVPSLGNVLANDAMTGNAPLRTPGADANSAAPSAGAGSRVRATPAARRAARDRGIAIEDVAAKLPGKVIGEDDVRNFTQ